MTSIIPFTGAVKDYRTSLKCKRLLNINNRIWLNIKYLYHLLKLPFTSGIIIIFWDRYLWNKKFFSHFVFFIHIQKCVSQSLLTRFYFHYLSWEKHCYQRHFIPNSSSQSNDSGALSLLTRELILLQEDKY